MDKLLTTENISKAGIVGLLAIVLVTGSMGVWVWGTNYQEMVKQRDEWKTLAMEGLRVSKEVSAARLPILAEASEEVLSAEKVASQLKTIEQFNEVPEL